MPFPLPLQVFLEPPLAGAHVLHQLDPSKVLCESSGGHWLRRGVRRSRRRRRRRRIHDWRRRRSQDGPELGSQCDSGWRQWCTRLELRHVFDAIIEGRVVHAVVASDTAHFTKLPERKRKRLQFVVARNDALGRRKVIIVERAHISSLAIPIHHRLLRCNKALSVTFEFLNAIWQPNVAGVVELIRVV